MLDLDLRPGLKQLRDFGTIALVAFGLLGALLLWKRAIWGLELGKATEPIVYTLWALGGASGLFSLIAPSFNRPLYLCLTILTFPIGFVLSFVVLAILFYGLITPVAILFRLLGRDPLQRRMEPDRKSYWEPHRPRLDKGSYFRQF